MMDFLSFTLDIWRGSEYSSGYKTLLAFTCSKPTTEALEKGVKYVQS